MRDGSQDHGCSTRLLWFSNMAGSSRPFLTLCVWTSSSPSACLQVLRSTGKFFLIHFLLFFSPGCFALVSLIVAVVAAAICEQEQLRAAEASRKEREFHRIVQALKRREEEEVKSGEEAVLLLKFKHSSFSILTATVTVHVRAHHRQPPRRKSREVQMKTARKAKRNNKPGKEVKPLKQASALLASALLLRRNTGRGC